MSMTACVQLPGVRELVSIAQACGKSTARRGANAACMLLVCIQCTNRTKYELVQRVRGQSGNTVVSKRPKTPHRPNAASMVGLPPSGYRITAQDGHLASCDGNKQAITPVGVSLRRFLAVSDIGAFCFNSVVSSKSGRKLVKIVVSLGPVDVEISLRWWCYCPRWPIAPMWWA